MGGKGATVEKKRKKKKGRPSLLDLQKRSLKQQHQLLRKHEKNKLKNSLLNNSNSNNNNNNNNTKPLPITPKPEPESPNPDSSSRRSTRRNSTPLSDTNNGNTNNNKVGRKQKKKLKLVVKLPDTNNEVNHNNNNNNNNDSGDEEGEEADQDMGNSDSAPTTGVKTLRKRKIQSISRGSISGIHHDKDEKPSVGVAATNQTTNTQQGCKVEDGALTTLPDKKLLLFILDRLQKKDNYGVFAEPVDPDELPDYHEVIQNPMDFSTVRRKLDGDAYGSLEQFEKDVFLICSNAMQYNAPDTIYFRQARSILELAKKDFENLRQDSDDNEAEPEAESEPKVVRRGRPPKQNLKRPPGRPPMERANPDFSVATLATAGGTTKRSNNELRKGPLNLGKHGSTDSFARTLMAYRNTEAYGGWSMDRCERADDVIGSASKGISMKHGKKQILLDDSRRNTYKQSHALACRQEPSVFTTFQGERKQLIAVGLHTEYGYARSLARFAAKLGPVAWKVATKKIDRCLPSGVKFGPGWVGDNEVPAEKPLQQLSNASGQASAPASLSEHADASSLPSKTLDSSERKPQVDQLPEACRPSVHPKLENESSKVISPPPAGNDATSGCSPIVSSRALSPNLVSPEHSATLSPSSMVNMLSSSSGSVRPGNSFQNHQVSNVQSRINGINGSYGLNFAAQMGKMIGASRPTLLNLPSNPSIVAVSRAESQRVCPPSTENSGSGEAKLSAKASTIQPADSASSAGSHQNVGSAPPDLNVGFHSPGSPVSGKSDSVQPDLALQL